MEWLPLPSRSLFRPFVHSPSSYWVTVDAPWILLLYITAAWGNLFHSPQVLSEREFTYDEALLRQRPHTHHWVDGSEGWIHGYLAYDWADVRVGGGVEMVVQEEQQRQQEQQQRKKRSSLA